MTSDTDTMPLEAYLAQGGKLTTPENAPPRYRGELLRLMATFVDSELAGAAGFADIINQGPGIKERIAASRIVLEKLDHAERVLAVMGAAIARPSLRKFRDRLSPPPAAPLLGLNGMVLKCHGGAGEVEYARAVRTAVDLARSDFADEIERNMRRRPGTAPAASGAPR